MPIMNFKPGYRVEADEWTCDGEKISDATKLAAIKKILEEIGFEKHVDIYNEPLLALQNFKAGQYGLLIIDVGMPVIETDR